MRRKNFYLTLIVSYALFLIGTSSEARAKMLQEQSPTEGEAVQPAAAADSGKAQGDATDDRATDRNCIAHGNRSRSVAPLKRRHPVPGLPQASLAREASGIREQAAAPEHHRSVQTTANETLSNSALPTRPANVVRRGTLASELRHRGPNPAVIDGLAAPNSEAASGLSGTRIHRKP